MNTNHTRPFNGFMRALFARSRHGHALPAFMNERVLRDIGILEPEEHMVEPNEELGHQALENHGLSIGITGL